MNPSDMLAPVTDEQALRQSEILALRAMADGVGSLNRRIDGYSVKQDQIMATLNEMKVELALTKERQSALTAVQANVTELFRRVNELEQFRSEQKGAAIFAKWLKDFGPWAIILIGGTLKFLHII